MPQKPFTVVVPTRVTDANFVSSTVLENDYPTWSAATPYITGDRRIVTTGYHSIYESLTSNTDKFPPDNPLDWVRVGPTSRWAAFDESGGTFTTGTDSIEFVVTGSRIDSFGFLDMANVLSIRVRATSTPYPNYFDETYTLKDRALLGSWYQYFNAPIERETLRVVFGVPAVANSTYTITLEGAGPISIGTFVMGRQKEFGFTEYGATVGTRSKGRIEDDEFGIRTRIRRGYSKRMNVQVVLKKSVTDAVKRQFEDLRETAALWVAADELYEATTIFGDYKDFSIVLSLPNTNQCSVEIEGIA